MTTRANKQHQKHAALIRPHYGDFGRLELGILGAPCSVIKQQVERWSAWLNRNWNIAYADADHKTGSAMDESQIDFLHANKVTFKRIDFKKEISHFTNRVLFNDQDLVFVNSNHFKAQKQVVIIYPEKSLENKLDKLTDVALILLADGLEVPEFIKQHLTDLNNIPILRLDDEHGIKFFFDSYLKDNIAPLNGLVLAAGKSTRMQADKGSIAYHGKSQKAHLYDLLSGICNEIYISGKAENEFNPIEDTFTGLGPYGGILSAMQKNPNAAWLVVACDLPYLSASTLKYLAAKRNPAKLATAFIDSDGKLPEPLITIWEPRAYPVLLQFLSQGYSCPRKVLINTDIELLNAPDVREFRNVNFPAERDKALKFFNPAAVSDSQ